MAFVFKNRARMTTTTTGTGTVTLGAAAVKMQTFAAAGVANGDTFHYVIEDGTAWEIGLGTYTSAGTTMARSLISSSTGSLLVLSGAAEVFIGLLDSDIAPALLASYATVINTQTGTSYTAVLADAGAVIEMNNAAANTLTIPLNSAVPYAVGTFINPVQLGAGITTITPTAGVTLRARNGLRTAGQYAMLTLYKRATDEWVVGGDTQV